MKLTNKQKIRVTDKLIKRAFSRLGTPYDEEFFLCNEMNDVVDDTITFERGEYYEFKEFTKFINRVSKQLNNCNYKVWFTYDHNHCPDLFKENYPQVDNIYQFKYDRLIEFRDMLIKKFKDD